jgi:hypothetical protein
MSIVTDLVHDWMADSVSHAKPRLPQIYGTVFCNSLDGRRPANLQTALVLCCSTIRCCVVASWGMLGREGDNKAVQYSLINTMLCSSPGVLGTADGWHLTVSLLLCAFLGKVADKVMRLSISSGSPYQRDKLMSNCMVNNSYKYDDKCGQGHI